MDAKRSRNHVFLQSDDETDPKVFGKIGYSWKFCCAILDIHCDALFSESYWRCCTCLLCFLLLLFMFQTWIWIHGKFISGNLSILSVHSLWKSDLCLVLTRKEYYWHKWKFHARNSWTLLTSKVLKRLGAEPTLRMHITNLPWSAWNSGCYFKWPLFRWKWVFK